MAITSDQIETAAIGPASTTIDGNAATARSADDIIKLANFAAAQQAIANGKPSYRMFRLIPPGTIGTRYVRTAGSWY